MSNALLIVIIVAYICVGFLFRRKIYDLLDWMIYRLTQRCREGSGNG